MNYGFRDYDDYVDAMNERKKNAEYLLEDARDDYDLTDEEFEKLKDGILENLLDDSEDDYEDYYLEEIIKDAIEDMRSDK